MIQDTKMKNPFIRQYIKDHFNENNNFLISKNKALSPLDEELNEVDIVQDFIKRNFYLKVPIVSNNVNGSSISSDQEI